MDYVQTFQRAADKIGENVKILADGSPSNKLQITGEGSPSNFHLNLFWKHLPGNENLTEPKHVIFDYIHHFIPQAKLLIVFRDPVDRLYSDYYHEYGTLRGYKNIGPNHFHTLVEGGLALYRKCFSTRTVRSCVYDPDLYGITLVQIQLGIYYVFWSDLLRLFPREQILVIQNKEMRDTRKTITTVYEFLGLRSLYETEMTRIINSKATYTRKSTFVNKGPMNAETRRLLAEFYGPFNQIMASLTGDPTFLYKTTS